MSWPNQYGGSSSATDSSRCAAIQPICCFDLASARYCAPAQASVACRSTGGDVNGIAQWIALELDEVTHYENRPGVAVKSNWAAVFHAFQHSIHTVPGQELRIYGADDREQLTIWI